MAAFNGFWDITGAVTESSAYLLSFADNMHDSIIQIIDGTDHADTRMKWIQTIDCVRSFLHHIISYMFWDGLFFMDLYAVFTATVLWMMRETIDDIFGISMGLFGYDIGEMFVANATNIAEVVDKIGYVPREHLIISTMALVIDVATLVIFYIYRRFLLDWIFYTVDTHVQFGADTCDEASIMLDHFNIWVDDEVANGVFDEQRPSYAVRLLKRILDIVDDILGFVQAWDPRQEIINRPPRRMRWML